MQERYIEVPEREYIALRRRSGGGIMNAILWLLTAGACVGLILMTVSNLGLMPPGVLPELPPPAVVLSTPAALPPPRVEIRTLPAPRPVQQPAPVQAPAPVVEQPAQDMPAPVVEEPPADPASFWTAEEQAAFAATAEAWYDPATLPTAPPAFVEEVQAACADPEKVAASATLQLWCQP